MSVRVGMDGADIIVVISLLLFLSPLLRILCVLFFSGARRGRQLIIITVVVVIPRELFRYICPLHTVRTVTTNYCRFLSQIGFILFPKIHPSSKTTTDTSFIYHPNLLSLLDIFFIIAHTVL